MKSYEYFIDEGIVYTKKQKRLFGFVLVSNSVFQQATLFRLANRTDDRIDDYIKKYPYVYFLNGGGLEIGDYDYHNVKFIKVEKPKDFLK
jgi:hypothetical protein